jgi:hypothetical protein
VHGERDSLKQGTGAKAFGDILRIQDRRHFFSLPLKTWLPMGSTGLSVCVVAVGRRTGASPPERRQNGILTSERSSIHARFDSCEIFAERTAGRLRFQRPRGSL